MIEIEKLENAISSMSDETMGRCLKSKEKAQEIEESLHIQNNILSAACSVHDIGMDYVKAKILKKSTALTQTEKDIISLHPYWGYKILSEYEVDDVIKNIVLYHHGNNPLTLTNNDILPTATEEEIKYAQMVYSIDCYIGLTSNRAYRKAFTKKEAYQIMKNNSVYQSSIILDYINQFEL